MSDDSFLAEQAVQRRIAFARLAVAIENHQANVRDAQDVAHCVRHFARDDVGIERAGNGAVDPIQGVDFRQAFAFQRTPHRHLEIGDLGRVLRVVKVVGYVASAPGFTGQPHVVNGASELVGEVFGDAGRHARSAVGVAVLPLDAPVEVEMVVEVD